MCCLFIDCFLREGEKVFDIPRYSRFLDILDVLDILYVLHDLCDLKILDVLESRKFLMPP